jgi:acetyl esterase/lipase
MPACQLSYGLAQGGGWHTGSRKSVARIGEQVQRLSFGCALLSPRLGPKDKFPAQAEDVADAFAWVKKDHVVLTESALGGAEVAIAFRPREE